MKLILPNRDRSLAGVELDKTACLEAVGSLPIQHDVVVTWAGGKNTRGRHRWKKGADGKFYHGITLSTFQEADQISRTLWHELCHAIQVEKLGWDRYREAYRSYSGWGYSSAYLDNPFERQARQMGDNHLTRPLAKQVVPNPMTADERL